MNIEKFTISRDDQIYEAWPDVVLTKDGQLICVFAECTHHNDRSFTRLVLCKSDDRGRTWSEKQHLTQGTNGIPYWNCPRISRMKDDRLIIVADKIFAGNELGGKVYYWIGNSQETAWDGPISTPVTGIVPDKLCELNNGRWILSAHDRNNEGFLEQKLWYSDNQGGEWQGPVTVASQNGLNLCEVSILSLPDEILVAFLRENSSQGWDCYKTISYDNGESWSDAYNVPLPGCHRPVAGHLSSGRILITYRFMQGGKGWLGTWTQNFFAALTDIESVKATERKEQWTRILPIDFDRSLVADLGYSGWVQFEDGEIYIVNYIVDDAPNGQIRGYSLREENFLIDNNSLPVN
ncbi:sialidase family protein [Sporosarcina sp. YIM B06819]|uniref:sialidase family protein n=1 Tax=Sporosarcina sp. YIM B06819 TaxID=3081769 RepID=UPI00298C3A60|nr:sialidase family protein [Sporosarcina sp. YIM B06819]